MKVTDEMLAAAMKTAVAAGLVAKHVEPDEYLKIWDDMKQSIQSALDANQTLLSMNEIVFTPGQGFAIAPN